MYTYQKMRANLFSEAGVQAYVMIRDHVRELLAQSGAVRMAEATQITVGGGDSWLPLACVDRMVEVGELVEVTKAGTPTQLRVFVKG